MAVDVHLAVGPADGWSARFVAQHERISLGPLTLPHESAAVVLMERLYRAHEIDRGSAYHRE